MTGGESNRPVEVLHKRGDRSLVRYENPDGTWSYAVADGEGRFTFRGTKAEAKKVYGKWRGR